MSEMQNIESMKLNDEQLENFTGGSSITHLIPIMCECGHINQVDVNKSSYICAKCGKKHYLEG